MQVFGTDLRINVLHGKTEKSDLKMEWIGEKKDVLLSQDSLPAKS